MQTIFLFLCQLQLQSPYPQFPGWLLWKLPQPKSWNSKDGLTEHEILEASLVQGGKERDKLEVDDQPRYIQQVNLSMFPDSCLCRWYKAVYFYEPVNLIAYFWQEFYCCRLAVYFCFGCHSCTDASPNVCSCSTQASSPYEPVQKCRAREHAF